jgi:monoterpene epsilon-lactone hydrolase
MKIKTGEVFKHIVKHFGKSRLAFMRDKFIVDSVFNRLLPIPDSVSACTRKISLEKSDVFMIRPPTYRRGRYILFCHGGAFCFSMSRLYLPFAFEIAKATESQVVMPDYRLAPEHPYPAALVDCAEAFRWVVDSDKSFDKFAILGDSAGGNLALSIAQEEPQTKGLCLLSPWLDLSQSSKTWLGASADDFVHPAAAKRAAWFYVL